MKAAVLHTLGTLPTYEDFPDPIPQNPQQLVLTVAAASLKNIDKIRASGAHYASYTALPVVVGLDAVGTLADGTRVYAQGVTGTMAERALIERGRYTPVPAALPDATAAALPNAVIGAAMALKYRAAIQPGATVLINGATGVTGQLAVQLAKHYGAGRVIATGRNADSLERTKALGANATLSLAQHDATLVGQLRELHAATPVDIVLDYLWGHPIELILAALSGGGLNRASHRVRVVTVGSMAGENITLASGTLRSSDFELLGSGFGSLSPDDLRRFGAEVLPEMFALAAAGNLTIQTEAVALNNIEAAWQQQAAPGSRLVVTMPLS